MTETEVIEQVARAIVIARGEDPDLIVFVGTLAVTRSGYTVAPLGGMVALWTRATAEARAAFICSRDLLDIGMEAA